MHRLLLALACIASTAQAAPSILYGTPSDPGYTTTAPAINAVLGVGKVDNPIFNDICNTCNLNTVVGESSNTGATFNSIATGNPVNHAPYQVVTASALGLPATPDSLYYATLTAQGALFSLPYGSAGPSATRSGPPIAASYTSSTNSSDGSTGWGIEWGLSAGYLGLNTSDDSHDAPAVSGFIAALEYNHATWNPYDVKAALRITASRWVTGYDHTHYGYGLLNWSAANVVATLYLQPPGVAIQNFGYYAVVTLYPFRQTRRSVEVVYSVPASYSWPVKNEYTLADLTASGGTLIYTSNGTDGVPQFTYAPAATGTVTFAAFTSDGSGGYSRHEEFTDIAESFVVGSACNGP